MAKKKVYVCFDYDRDKHFKYLMNAWDANPDFDFSFNDQSPDEIQSNDISVIKGCLTKKIKDANYTVVLAGKDADKQHKDHVKIGYKNWQNFEVATKRIAAYSKHEGILSVDCFKNEKGVFIIEMNCRISGHYPLAYLAGMNYPQQLIDWLRGMPTNPELFKFETELYITKDLKPMVLYKNNKNSKPE